MAPPGLRREKYLLTFGIVCVQDERYASLLKAGSICQMWVTNLRNRPVRTAHIDSMQESIPSLYHSLLTGSKDFPLINCESVLHSHLMTAVFSTESQLENTTPSPLTEAPAGMVVPPAGSSSPPPNVLTPPLPQKAELGALKADSRNCVHTVVVDGSTVYRVISTVYRNDHTERENLWRVTDYNSEGSLLMSVFFQFDMTWLDRVQTPTKRKREEDSSSSSLPSSKKRLRV